MDNNNKYNFTSNDNKCNQGQTNSKRETSFNLTHPLVQTFQQKLVDINLIDKNFPQDDKFPTIFNRNNIKVSYSCIPNIKSAINLGNRKIRYPFANTQSRT